MWRKHDGRDSPFRNADEQPVIEVGFRCRHVSRPEPADKWRWKWGFPFPDGSAWDIVAWRRP